MDNKLRYISPEQQIERLKKKHLIINDEIIAKDILTIYGYHNVISKYKKPYITYKDGSSIYKDNITFERIFSLFLFDHYLREAVIFSMLDLEEHLRGLSADIISRSFGTDHNIYLDRRNYRNKRVRNQSYSLKKVLEEFTDLAKSDNSLIKKYREKYSIVPPWILFNSAYLSSLINLVYYFKAPQKEQLITAFYGLTCEDAKEDCVKELLTSTLSICRDYRNRTAHNGTIYDYSPKSTDKLPKGDKLNSLEKYFPGIHNQLTQNHGLSILIYLLNILAYKNSFTMIHDELSKELNRHAKTFCGDIPFLEKALGIKISVITEPSEDD